MRCECLHFLFSLHFLLFFFLGFFCTFFFAGFIIYGYELEQRIGVFFSWSCHGEKAIQTRMRSLAIAVKVNAINGIRRYMSEANAEVV